jgi:RNA-binding protein YlmH
VQANGERLDALIAKAFSLSRDMAQSYFSKGLVFVSGRCTENTSYIPKEGEVVSVRGLGRFIYRGVVGHSRKGKLNIALDLYK